MKSDPVIIKVKVKPNSKKNEVIKKDDIYHVKVTDSPVNGKANERTIELLSEFFDVPKSKFKILQGLTSKNKIIELKGN